MTSIGLASQSPRRRELLQQIGVPHQVVRVNVPEQRAKGEAPLAYVQRLACAKATAGAELSSIPVLGADTIVVCGDQVLEKPAHQADFLQMFNTLSGTTHQVVTAVALALPGCQVEVQNLIVASTDVRFRAVSEAEALAYWHTGEPADKAGGYGIQGFGAVFVESISGSYSNVVGLPLYETAQLLSRHQLGLWSPRHHE